MKYFLGKGKNMDGVGMRMAYEVSLKLNSPKMARTSALDRETSNFISTKLKTLG